MAKIIDGKVVSAEVKAKVAAESKKLAEKGVSVKLAVVIVGDDPASKTYVNNKKKACAQVGFESEIYELPESTTQEELLKLVNELNSRKDVNGILCQSPLPKQIDENLISNTINPIKDVDAFNPANVGHIMIGDYKFLPCTPAGVIELLKYYNIDIAGKKCVVIGRSNIVGKPMAMMLLHNNGTVVMCHSKTKDLKEVTKQADILVSAIGKTKFITADMVKNGAVVVDVGMNRDENNKLCGDVDFANVEPVADYITPVPGGVGLMTVAMLMQNTLMAAKLQNGLE